MVSLEALETLTGQVPMRFYEYSSGRATCAGWLAGSEVSSMSLARDKFRRGLGE